MDGQRFDALARLFGAPKTRRAFARASLGGAATIAAQPSRPARAADVCPSRAPRPGYTPSTNGCGPGFGSVIIPQTYGKASFRQSCNRHDECYGTCNANRGRCDRDFQLDLKRACYKAYPDRDDHRKLVKCTNAAQRYYEAVAAFGAGPYATAQEEACICCNDKGPEFPTGPKCGAGDRARCCEPGQKCVGGKCCDRDRVCEGVCCRPGEECCNGTCKASCTSEKVYCNCNKTCYDDVMVCLDECKTNLGCFTAICGPAEAGQCPA